MQYRFRDGVMGFGAVRGKAGLERVVLGTSDLDELVQNLAVKDLPRFRRILRAVVLLEIVHDALGDGVSLPVGRRPGRIVSDNSCKSKNQEKECETLKEI